MVAVDDGAGGGVDGGVIGVGALGGMGGHASPAASMNAGMNGVRHLEMEPGDAASAVREVAE
jgi:hypothetical protein